MTNAKLKRIQELVESASSSLTLAKQMMYELTGEEIASSPREEKYAPSLRALPESDAENIIEGIFDGQKMLGKDGRIYPVPPNYASKSKLVPGDTLKLTIAEDGSFIYKQIGPIERKRIIGTVVYEDGEYKVLTNDKVYKVLLASITYYKASPNSRVTLIVPANEDADYGAIENVLPE